MGSTHIGSLRESGSAIRASLLRWYQAHKRELPWRATRDPYRVWISEIMLQQTRVSAVLGYYERFLRRFPSIEALARAREHSVLAAWSGLGYYRRARGLHRAAKQIVGDRHGIFPATALELRVLPGVGRYTAAAIASIAFNQPCAVVDGNVERVLQRLTGERLSGDGLWDCAQRLLSRRHPGDFNQAMMELGATVCLPGQPRCEACPVMRWCATRGQIAGKEKEVRRKRAIAYQLSVRSESVWLVQRAKNDSLMAGMWELPQCKASSNEVPSNETQPFMRLKHSITTTDYDVAVFLSTARSTGRSTGRRRRQKNGRWTPLRMLARIPLTGLARKILRRADMVI
jgi:A/G-specific adenine glycosylase